MSLQLAWQQECLERLVYIQVTNQRRAFDLRDREIIALMDLLTSMEYGLAFASSDDGQVEVRFARPGAHREAPSVLSLPLPSQATFHNYNHLSALIGKQSQQQLSAWINSFDDPEQQLQLAKAFNDEVTEWQSEIGEMHAEAYADWMKSQ